MATERPATQAKRILVVEDEPMIRMLLEDMLGELGYTIAAEAVASDGMELWEARTQRPDWRTSLRTKFPANREINREFC
jgi:CheY-like chemotaxis protein